ncbi:substrate-binding domain-containing protein [Streptomyces sp. WAC01280]|uniref:substrate-binding domain-containing protein n=1 Tax=Streptomyces sp. WAC01280 TaxID=2487424 RepID=UPI000F76DB2F|nr:substrate-binding domain-containing protein [Streptomyces sp. WAC01280]RSS59065.1 DeoR family transcriptional regulator [Streptomyces sp. WAC01280]
MLAEERRETLLRLVERRGSVKVTDVAEEMGVSAVTVRQDVRELAGRGLLVRVHGGAMSPSAAQAADTAAPAAPRATHALGLVVPPGDYYYPEIIRGVQDAARTHGARIVLAVSGETLEENQEQVRRLVAGGVDGLMLMLHAGLEPAERTEKWLAGLDVPVVLVDRRAGAEAGRLEQVASDHAHGAGLAVRHLAELGHERIALVARAESPNTPLIREGYAAALRALGLTPGPEYSIGPSDGSTSTQWFEELVRAVEAGDVRAALVHNDLDAVTLVGLLQARALRVPEDLAIVTYDDEVAELSDVPLTAVAPPKRAVGAWAVDLMRRRLADPGAPLAELLLRPELRVRASSRTSAAPGRRS